MMIDPRGKTSSPFVARAYTHNRINNFTASIRKPNFKPNEEINIYAIARSIGGTVLLGLTINGLLAASVCSHLGLPDLFDTETGLSAIGRFGLMDGQGIFAYSGTYPPEPTPWSKIYLGWAEPVTVTQENFNASLVTNLAASIADTVIVPMIVTEFSHGSISKIKSIKEKEGSAIMFLAICRELL